MQKLAISIVCSQILEVVAKRMYSKEDVVFKTMQELEEFESENPWTDKENRFTIRI